MRITLNKDRKRIYLSRSRKLIYSILIFVVGVILGVISKVLDETPSNHLPIFLENLDLGNFFSRMGVWIFLAVTISLYSKSPVGSALNTFLFFVGMLSSYYLYTITIVGFLPKSYMMIWVVMSIISPFLAFVCWYAKGKGIISIFISSIIFMFFMRQALTFGFWYFDIKYILELLLLFFITFLLYQSPKQIMKVIIIGVVCFFLTANINIFGGML